MEIAIAAEAAKAEPKSSAVLLGDEAVAAGAADAGLTAAYGYPGTPSTEIIEALQARARGPARPIARWCANEKTAYEGALGTSLVGRRALVTMKHVGLNVAADPFMNSALVDVRGGLVVAVADDPGMHSSQNEQDTRLFADFARTACLEPSSQQEAYDMTRAAFDLSERFHLPVVLRLVTRLAHSRAAVSCGRPRAQNPLAAPPDAAAWTLLPSNARRRWRHLLDLQGPLQAWSEESGWNRLELGDDARGLGVITTGLARNYYLESLDELGFRPSHLHIGAYPMPVGLIRKLAASCRSILVLEEGYPYVERQLRGVLEPGVAIRGKLGGELPLDGELTPDTVRGALGLPERPSAQAPRMPLPQRPPQLCTGCPHRDSYEALHRALPAGATPLVASDIGCYTLGALEPISMGSSCVCMGASIGMAKGASEAGQRPAVAVIGDSTFYHSGITPLVDAVSADADMTVIILDNGIVGMTGLQETILPSSQLEQVILGLGVKREHLKVIEAHPRKVEQMAEVMRAEIAHPGLSVIIAVRECIEAARVHKKEGKVTP